MEDIILAVVGQAKSTLAKGLATVQDFALTCIGLLGYGRIIFLALVLSTCLGGECIVYRASLSERGAQARTRNFVPVGLSSTRQK